MPGADIMESTPETIEQLQDDYRRLADKVEELRKPETKDIWDKLGSLTGVIVALVGGLFSLLYNSNQSRQDEALKKNQAELQKIQLVGTFMPYLAGADERARTIALFEVQDILNTKAAIALAVNVSAAKSAGESGAPSEGAVQFLQTVATTASSVDRDTAVKALATLCGIERLSVKTMADKDAVSVNLHPEKTTVESLVQLPRPASLPESARLDEERKTYTVVADVTSVKLERDGDYHIVLRGASGETIVAEVISPGCYSGNNPDIRNDFQVTRDTIDSAFLGRPRGTERDPARLTSLNLRFPSILPTKVEVTGVGFFDRVHRQPGMSRNGLELHPVLSLRVLQDQKPAPSNRESRVGKPPR